MKNYLRHFVCEVIRLGCLFLALGVLLLPLGAKAAITVTGGTPSNVTVEPGATIPATVEVTLTGGTRWRSTEWRIAATSGGGFNCLNTTNYNSGTNSVGFNMTAPTAAGVYNLYFRGDTDNDCAGTNSAIYLAGTVTIPELEVLSITRTSASPTTAGTVSWTVVFNRAVTGVSTPDFSLINTGLGGTPAITAVSGSGTTYTITASTGTGSGTLGLNLVDNDSIRDTSAAANRLGGTGTGNGNFTGQVYTIDRAVPTVSSINRNTASPTGAASVSWTVIFSETVTGVDAADFALASSGVSGPAISSVTGSGSTYTVTASTGTGNGTIGLNLVDNDSIMDAASNRLGGTGAGNGNFTGQVYTIGKSAPVLLTATSICGLNQVMVSFSEALDTASAQTAANYSITGASVSSATLLADGKTVLLQTSAMTTGGLTLTVSNVRNTSLIAIAAGSQAGFTHTGGTLTQGIRGLYYGQNGVQRDYFTGTPVERIDGTIDFNWANGIPVTGIAADDFSVKWTGFVRPPLTGSYQLQTSSDDGVRLYLNGQNLIDNWTDHSVTTNTATAINLSANQYYPVQMDFYERGGQAEAHLLGSYENGGFSVVPAAYLYYCSVPVTAVPGAFNAFESSTLANQTTGVIKTKVAGTAFSLDLIALNSAKNAIQTGFTGSVKVELVSNTSAAGPGTNMDNTTNCPMNLAVLSTSTTAFIASDNGRKAAVSFAAVPNVWQDVRVRITYPDTGTATVMSCSNDNFAIRPASLAAITASDANWRTAGAARNLNNTVVSSGSVHKAGQPFRLAATAYNSLGIVTSNYQGSPAATVTSCLATLGDASSCTSILGTFNVGAWSAAAVPANGTVASTTATYSEAGSFYLQLGDETFAAVDDKTGDSTAAERYVPLSAKFAIGRFVPDHFVVTTVNTPQLKTFNDTSCPTRSFTYIGQKFGYVTPPIALISARNASDLPTKNYQGRSGQGNHLWKLTAGDVAQAYASTSATLDTPEIGTVAIAPKNDDSGTGLVTVNAADLLKYVRDTATPRAPFTANINLTIYVVDATELSGASPAETINTTSSAVFGSISGIGFDAGREFRYGILKMSNAHGSELLKLPIPLEAQYWNGTGFVTNTADHCTSIDGLNVTLDNYKKNLNACETTVPSSGRLASGKGSFLLSAPGANNSGSVDLRINLGNTAGSACIPPNSSAAATSAKQDYLQIKSGASYTADPQARATFGVRKSGPVIYLRELYW